jgi:Ca2+-binding RTX toxin-like protein
VSGDLGNDSLIGGVGADTLSGGSGTDTFGGAAGDFGTAASNTTGGTFETILDFVTGSDKLDLAVAGTNADYTELTPAATFGAALTAANTSFAATAGLAYVAVTVGADTYLFIDEVGGTGATGVSDGVIKLTGITTDQLTFSDII